MLRIAIIGRPNVGKSTLFNRLVGRKTALVYDTPGVTRDRQEEKGRIADLEFLIMDTAGLEDQPETNLQYRMTEQTLQAIKDADVLLFMIDAQIGVTPTDEYFATRLRTTPKPVLLIANKCEGRKGDEGIFDGYRLGLGDPIPLSAEHGLGMDDLYTYLKNHARVSESEKEESHEKFQKEFLERPLQLAIVGRPNVGKSTLINTLLKEDRLLTGPEAGITRDAIAINWYFDHKPIRLYDTAGLRRKARISQELEELSVKDTLQAIQFAEIAILVIDAEQPLDKQDLQIARHIVEEGRGLVIALNKWDLIKNPSLFMKEVQFKVDESLSQARGVSLVPISGLNGQNLDKLMKAVLETYTKWNKRIPTGDLNRWLKVMLEEHSLPLIKGRRLKIRYMTQTKARPPSFALFISQDVDFPIAYERYLMNGLREAYGLEGIPLRFYYRKSKNPFAREDR